MSNVWKRKTQGNYFQRGQNIEELPPGRPGQVLRRPTGSLRPRETPPTLTPPISPSPGLSQRRERNKPQTPCFPHAGEPGSCLGPQGGLPLCLLHCLVSSVGEAGRGRSCFFTLNRWREPSWDELLVWDSPTRLKSPGKENKQREKQAQNGPPDTKASLLWNISASSREHGPNTNKPGTFTACSVGTAARGDVSVCRPLQPPCSGPPQDVGGLVSGGGQQRRS